MNPIQITTEAVAKTTANAAPGAVYTAAWLGGISPSQWITIGTGVLIVVQVIYWSVKTAKELRGRGGAS